MSRDDVLDKFARNSHWLFGKNAREIGASLMKTEKISLDALLRQVGSGASQPVETAV